MKKATIIIMLTLLAHYGSGQIVLSSCIAHDSIVKKYQTDADRLTVRMFYQYNLPYKDSIVIPQAHSDTLLDALIAVYNATSLPARDTVVSMHSVHTWWWPELNSIVVGADSNLIWVQQIRNGIFPTADSTINSIMNYYDLYVSDYIDFYGAFFYHLVVFTSDNNYNIKPLSDIFKAIPSVYDADPMSYGGDGNDISSIIHSDHVELIYSVGWGDCLAGCMSRRFWKFRVYYDCSVEYVSSYGDPLPVITMGNLNKKPSIEIYPNPFEDHIHLRGMVSDCDYVLYSTDGRELLRGKTMLNKIHNLDRFPSGHYLLRIQTDGGFITYPLIKP